MKNKTGFAVLVILSLALCLGGSLAAQAKTHTLKMQAVYKATGPSGQMFKKWADKVDNYTKGQVKIQIFQPNQLVKIKEAYDATAKGMVDGTLSSLIYYGGTVPEAKTAFLSFTWKNPDQAADLFLNKGYLEMLRKANAKHNVRYVSPIMVGSFGFMTKFPVKSAADFKGKKFRASGMDGLVVKNMGASAVVLPVGEMYMALQRGTVDGIVFPYYTIDSYKFYEVVKTVVQPAFRNPSLTSIFMNLDVWKSLPLDLQKAIDKASREMLLESAQASARWDAEAIEVCKKHGLQIATLPAADVKKLRTDCLTIWDNVAKGSPLSKEIVELFKKNLLD